MANNTSTEKPEKKSGKTEENRFTKIWSSITSTIQNIPSEWSSLLPSRNKTTSELKSTNTNNKP